jgi:hypothetical protein
MSAVDTDPAERIEGSSPFRRGITVWFAVFGGVAAWTLHLLFVAAFVEYSCNVGDVEWPMHLATAVTALLTIAAMGLSVRLFRSGRHHADDEPTPGGRLHYLGVVGLLIGAINLALILAEGSYVLALGSCVR